MTSATSKCIKCGTSVAKPGRSGPAPKYCADCKLIAGRERSARFREAHPKPPSVRQRMTCKVCGNRLWQQPPGTRGNAPQYCDACRAERRRESDRGQKRKKWKATQDARALLLSEKVARELPCPRCGEPFRPFADGVRTKRYCSPKCRHEAELERDAVRARERRAAKSPADRKDGRDRRDYEFMRGLRRRFGLTREEYEAKLAAQGGVCAICGGTAPKGKGNRFAIDHDHRFPTELVEGHRGLLCGSCNSGLGLMQESPRVLRAAIEYLARYGVR